MFLDNRRGLEDDIKHLSEEDKERVLNAFDWAVCKAIGLQKSYEIFKEELVKRCGKEMKEVMSDIETRACSRFMECEEECYKYQNDVASGKRVGYSAERVEQED